MFKFALTIAILAVISLGILIYPNFSHKMPYKEPTKAFEFEYQRVDYKMSSSQIKNRIADLVGVRFYWCREKQIDGRVGNSNIYLRRVYIDSGASQNDYIETFCHELIHIKHFTANERFVNYKTFIVLYESEFRQVAINMAWEMQNGQVDKEYNCLAQICDYLAQ